MIDRAKLEEKVVEYQKREAELRGMIDFAEQLKYQSMELDRSLEVLKDYQGDKVYKIYGSIMVEREKEDVVKELQNLKNLLDNKLKELEGQIKVKGESLERLRSVLEQELKGA